MSATSETRSWDAVVTSTLEASMGDLQNNINKGVNLLAYLREKDKIKLVDGGQRIKADLLYGKNTTVKSNSAYGLLDTTPQDGITAAFLDWKEVDGTLVISRKERRQNSGKHALFSLIESKRTQLEMSFQEEITRQLLSDGTGNEGLDLTGLALAVEVTPSTSYGGISPSTETWWKNQSEASAGSFAAGGLDLVRKVYRLCQRGVPQSAPDLALCDGTTYDAWEAQHLLHLQFTPTGKMNEAMANLGIENFMYKKAVVMEEEQMDNIGTGSTGRIYLLNSKFIKFVVDKDSNFVTLGANTPSNQKATIAPFTLMANLATHNRRKLGVIDGLTA